MIEPKLRLTKESIGCHVQIRIENKKWNFIRSGYIKDAGRLSDGTFVVLVEYLNCPNSEGVFLTAEGKLPSRASNTQIISISPKHNLSLEPNQLYRRADGCIVKARYATAEEKAFYANTGSDEWIVCEAVHPESSSDCIDKTGCPCMFRPDNASPIRSIPVEFCIIDRYERTTAESVQVTEATDLPPKESWPQTVLNDPHFMASLESGMRTCANDFVSGIVRVLESSARGISEIIDNSTGSSKREKE